MFVYTCFAAALIAAFAVWLWARSRGPEATPDSRTWRDMAASTGLSATPAMVADDLEDQRKTRGVLARLMREAGVFKEEAVERFTADLEYSSAPFACINTEGVFAGDTTLTLAEKRTLGLNTRKKYSHRLVDMYRPECLSQVEPKSYLANLHLKAFHQIARERTLAEFRAGGFVTSVKIQPCGDERDCPKIARFKKMHPIDSVPLLPIPGCTAAYCRCSYQPYWDRP